MIRFIDLTGQIYNDDEPAFAWFNTGTDEFMKFDEQDYFDTWAEFERCHEASPSGYPLERFRKLFPW